MKTTRNFTCIVLATLVAAAAWAGDDGHKKCASDTNACVQGMVEKLSNRGWIGIEWDDKSEAPSLTLVVEDSPAQRAGLMIGDELLAFNGVLTSAGAEAVWAEAKKSLIPGKTITLTIKRAGVKKNVEVLLGHIPRAVMAQWIGNHVLDHHLAEKKSEGAEAETESP